LKAASAVKLPVEDSNKKKKEKKEIMTSLRDVSTLLLFICYSYTPNVQTICMYCLTLSNALPILFFLVFFFFFFKGRRGIHIEERTQQQFFKPFAQRLAVHRVVQMPVLRCGGAGGPRPQESQEQQQQQPQPQEAAAAEKEMGAGGRNGQRSETDVAIGHSLRKGRKTHDGRLVSSCSLWSICVPLLLSYVYGTSG
jgi:hypothetical protein